jgi:pimeloyl-ACP methyl ester carboxylesterase
MTFVAASTAQSLPPVAEAPPKITFEPGRNIESEDENPTSREIQFRFPTALPSPEEENNSVPIRLLLPLNAREKLPAVIILHYWGASDQKIELAMASDLNRRGIAAVLVALPYHLGRTPKGFRSGQRAIQPDPAALRFTMTQSVYDVRRTIDLLGTLPEIDSSRLGIAGISLGSLVASLSYAVEPRLQSAGFMLGGVDLAHIIWNSSRVVSEREKLRQNGFTENRLRDELASVEPLSYLGQRVRPRAFVIGGRFDTVVPPEDTKKLINALPGTQALWLDTGHYGGAFVQRRIIREIGAFMQAEFGGTEYKAPTRIFAPTVRIAAESSTEYPLQVGIAVDLFATPRRDAFVTLMASPRGPKLFGGFRIEKGVAIGVYGSPKRASFGILWSTIL